MKKDYELKTHEHQHRIQKKKTTSKIICQYKNPEDVMRLAFNCVSHVMCSFSTQIILYGGLYLYEIIGTQQNLMIKIKFCFSNSRYQKCHETESVCREVPRMIDFFINIESFLFVIAKGGNFILIKLKLNKIKKKCITNIFLYFYQIYF